MASDTPPFMSGYTGGPSTSRVDTPDNSLPGATPSATSDLANEPVPPQAALWGGNKPSLVDTPDNSLPGSAAPELSPVEAAAEASRIEAAAAERAVQAAALEKVLTEGAGPDRMVTFTDSEGGTHTVSIDEFMSAQGYVPSEVVKSGYEIDPAANLTFTTSNIGSGVVGGRLVFTSQTGPVARTEIDNGTVTAFDRAGKISWQGNLVDMVASQVQGAPEAGPNTAETGPAALTQGREKTHGSYSEMSAVTMDLMEAFQDTRNWDTLPPGVKVMFFNVAQKSARILTGNPLVQDHYADIAGYAYLAEQEVSGYNDLPDGNDGTH